MDAFNIGERRQYVHDKFESPSTIGRFTVLELGSTNHHCLTPINLMQATQLGQEDCNHFMQSNSSVHFLNDIMQVGVVEPERNLYRGKEERTVNLFITTFN